jgi:hypothetical protein
MVAMESEIPDSLMQLINRKRLSRESVLRLSRMPIGVYQLIAEQVVKGQFDDKQIRNILFIISCFVIGHSEVRSVYIGILSALLNHADMSLRDSAALGLVWLLSYRSIPRRFVSPDELNRIESTLRSVSPSMLSSEVARQLEQALQSNSGISPEPDPSTE